MTLIDKLFFFLEENLRVTNTIAQIISFVIFLAILIAVFVILRFFLSKFIHRIIRATRTQLDDALVNHKVIQRSFFLIPLIIIYSSANLFPIFGNILPNLLKIMILWNFAFILSAFLNSINFIYSQAKHSKHRPIKGYLQIVAIFFYVIISIATLAIVMGKSPWLLLSSLGAMTAVILFIFKDTILSLLASFQITFNDLIRNGDWLDIPQFNANGTVIDVALHSIKIQNWDKTISIIPTHKLLEGSFKNWQGMTNSGGRRIKRALYIDMNSIKFLDTALIKNMKKIAILKPYLASKEKEIRTYNIANGFEENDYINSRKLTNIGTFRAYIEAYMKNHPLIRQDMTLIIRQLDVTDKGLPLEIYAFSADIEWANYEAIQSDIFDHFLAIISQFELRIFQTPSGLDFQQLKN